MDFNSSAVFREFHPAGNAGIHQELAQYLREKIAWLNSPYVSGVRGMGLMIGVGIQGMTHAEAAAKLREAGLLCLTAGSDTLRLLPPLTITRTELDEGLAIMKKVLCE